MKKVLSLVLAALLVAAMLCACTPNADTNPTTTGTPAGSTPAPTTTGGAVAPQGPTVVNVADYFSDESKWEADADIWEIEDNKLVFDTFYAGDFCAVRLKEEFQDVTYKFNVQITDLPEATEENWWDIEFIVVARSALAANSFADGEQTGYCLTAWGDMKQVCIGRAGYDDAFGTFDWNVADGQPHDIEFTVVNNEDGTVTIKLVVDGTVIAEEIDDGSKVKNDRPNLYPDAGGLTIRAKWMGLTIA